MFHRTSVRYLAAVSMLALLSACVENPLEVDNRNNPDVDRVYASPANVETTVSQLFKNMYNGQYADAENLWTQTLSMSFESHSQQGNFGMGTRAAIPRNPIDNSIGNGQERGNFRDFDHLSRNSKSAANTIAAINNFAATARSIGGPARDARAKSFAYFSLGYGLGSLSLLYDSAAIILPSQASDEIPPFSGYAAVNAAAIEALDSALAIANTAAAAGTGGWPIPTDWMSTATTIDRPTWIRMLRSYRAKFRAGVARTAAERTAVNWQAVAGDAANGITADFVVNHSAANGWGVVVGATSAMTQLRVGSNWSQMTPMLLGMADSTGAYDAWLATPLLQRTPFLLRTSDQRFPSGETRAIQTAITGTVKAGPAAGSILYFRNRPGGEDTPAEPWGTWYYDNWRFWSIGSGGGNGPFVAHSVAETDMLAAEAYLRTGNIPAAATLIDKTRLRAGLPSVAGITSLTQQVPGGNSCVPRVPQAPSFTSTACGTIFEAMKWEKRVETSFTGYAQWYVDSRGWGDLTEGTALHWPVPYQELFARLLTSYSTQERAVRGTYGF